MYNALGYSIWEMGLGKFAVRFGTLKTETARNFLETKLIKLSTFHVLRLFVLASFLYILISRKHRSQLSNT